MNIYFDFEATQFSERVIAIGASCDYGDFDCLVGLRKGDKLTPFITRLTGITKEMLAGAPKAEQAFADLYDWIGEMTAEADTPIFYHCYGDSDAAFLINTANKMDDSPVREFIIDLAESLLDDSRTVRQFFHSKAIGLHKALKYFDPELPDQTHDPLDDAIMLRKLMQHMETAEPPEECPYEDYKGDPNTNKPKAAKKTSNYRIEAQSIQNPEAKPKIFTSYRAAFDFCITKVQQNHPTAKRETMEKNCKKAIDNNATYLGRTWKKIFI